MRIDEMLVRNARMYTNEISLVERNAIRGTRREITWKQFEERANKMANALTERDVKKGDKVLLLMHNCIHWFESFFGIIRTGAWIVPLNYRFTGEDIKYCNDICEAKVLIYGQEFAEKVQTTESKLPSVENYICVGESLQKDTEEFEQVMDESSDKIPQVEIRDEDGCGLYFTAGTTGPPKGVLLTHKNMESAAITVCINERKRHSDNFVFLAPLYHVGSTMRWFGNLIVGSRGTMLIGTKPEYILEAMSKEKGTILMLVVPWARDIVEALERGEIRKEGYDLNRWRLVTLGAQPIPASLVMQWKEYFPEVQYDTGYGLTETAGTGVIHLGLENWRKAPAIGKPGFNWEARIVDEKDNEVALGEVGELIVKGNGVMKEYYKNPEETAKALKGGWLHTGDLAKVDEEGFIYLVERKKDLIISGGENIYPIDVESVLVRHRKIHDAALIGVPDERLGEIPVAIVEVKTGETLTQEEVTLFCEDNIPRYRRPRRIIFGKVPRTLTGKIEKHILREEYKREIII
jgi:acyl-CoA synthetase (AMP-forming)/AMP-acid ligase II